MRNHVATRKVGQRLKFAKFADMDETKVFSDESGRSSLSALRIRNDLEVDHSDEEDNEDNSEEVKIVESSIVDELGSGNSARSFAEVKCPERDESSVADLRDVESSSPPSEAKGDHSDGEDKEDKTEM